MTKESRWSRIEGRGERQETDGGRAGKRGRRSTEPISKGGGILNEGSHVDALELIEDGGDDVQEPAEDNPGGVLLHGSDFDLRS